MAAGSPGPQRPYPLLVRLIHDLTHRVPGVPKHADPASVRVEHEERHRARAAQMKARHEARGRPRGPGITGSETIASRPPQRPPDGPPARAGTAGRFLPSRCGGDSAPIAAASSLSKHF